MIFDRKSLLEAPPRLGLRELLESERPIKVVHDFRQDNDALFHQFGIRMRLRKMIYYYYYDYYFYIYYDYYSDYD